MVVYETSRITICQPMNNAGLAKVFLVKRVYLLACYLDYFYAAGTIGVAAKGYFMVGDW